MLSNRNIIWHFSIFSSCVCVSLTIVFMWAQSHNICPSVSTIMSSIMFARFIPCIQTSFFFTNEWYSSCVNHICLFSFHLLIDTQVGFCVCHHEHCCAKTLVSPWLLSSRFYFFWCVPRGRISVFYHVWELGVMTYPILLFWYFEITEMACGLCDGLFGFLRDWQAHTSGILIGIWIIMTS